MKPELVLASASPTRLSLLHCAGVTVSAVPARIDEDSVRKALAAEGITPRDQADALAEMKARKVAVRHPEAIVIGADQILDFNGQVYAKPPDLDAAKAQLRALRGCRHRLWSAVVLYHHQEAVWRHVGEVGLTMRNFSDAYLEDYASRNAGSLLATVGGYRIEGEGVRLFARIDGDYFDILGLPLLPLLSYLGQRGWIES